MPLCCKWFFRNICILWSRFSLLSICSVWLVCLASKIRWLRWHIRIGCIRIVSTITLVRTTSQHSTIFFHRWTWRFLEFLFPLMFLNRCYELLRFQKAIMMFSWLFNIWIRLSLSSWRLYWICDSCRNWRSISALLLLSIPDFIWILTFPIQFVRHWPIFSIRDRWCITCWAATNWAFSICTFIYRTLGWLFGRTCNTWLSPFKSTGASCWILFIFCFRNVFLCLIFKHSMALYISIFSWSDEIIFNNQLLAKFFVLLSAFTF